MNSQYQGYPYVNPPVVDAPTIDETTANQWSHLPRRQVVPVGPKNVKEENQNQQRANQIYIDLPEQNDSAVVQRPNNLQNIRENRVAKKDSVEPVVYIDLSRPSGSDVAQSRDNTPAEEPTFVQQTIYYDPFENRRIDQPKNDDDSDDSEPSPVPSRYVNHDGPGTSRGLTSPTSPLPSSMQKESQIYGGDPAMDTIPASQFRAPPPAYSEIDTRVTTPVTSPTEERNEQRNEERTRVILPNDRPSPVTMQPIHLPTQIINSPSTDIRKYLLCQQCGYRVHSLVIKENGTITHVTALFFMILCLIPCVALIYCTDILKVTNHYCPHCNAIIAYSLPFMKNKVVYSSS